MSLRRRHEIGFTLIELMIVVTIIAVLAVVAGTAYRRYMDNGRTTEAYAMLGEIRNKEEAYRAEFSLYAGWGGGAENEAKSLPAVDNTTCTTGGSKEPCPKCVPNSTGCGTTNTVWQNLGINPGRSTLQCGYIVNTDANSAGTLGTSILNGASAPWWYAIAICDNDGSTSKNAKFVTSSVTSTISAQDEHQ